MAKLYDMSPKRQKGKREGLPRIRSPVEEATSDVRKVEAEAKRDRKTKGKERSAR